MDKQRDGRGKYINIVWPLSNSIVNGGSGVHEMEITSGTMWSAPSQKSQDMLVLFSSCF